MHQSDYNISSELKKRLSRELDITGLRVYGSRARGDNDEYSDLDVLVELGNPGKTAKAKVRHIAWEVGLENGMVISTLVVSKHDMQDTPLRSASIIQNILSEGVAV